MPDLSKMSAVGLARTVRPHLPGLAGPVFNVRDYRYGVTLDGATDDTTGWQAALDDAKTAGSGTVFVPGSGTSLVSGLSLSSADNITIYAPEGATLKLADSSDATLLDFTSCDYLRIIGLSLNANRANQTAGPYHGIQLALCDHWRLQNVIVSAATDIGINIRGCTDGKATNVHTINCGIARSGGTGFGIYVRDSAGGTESYRCQFANCSDNGSGFDSGGFNEGGGLFLSSVSHDCQVFNYHSLSSVKYGLKIQGTLHQLDNILVRGSGNDAVALQGSNLQVGGITCENCASGVIIPHFTTTSDRKAIQVDSITADAGVYALEITNTAEAAAMTDIQIGRVRARSQTDYGVRVRGAVEQVQIEQIIADGATNEGFICESATETDTSTTVEPDNIHIGTIIAVGNDYGISLLSGKGTIAMTYATGNTTSDYRTAASDWQIMARDGKANNAYTRFEAKTVASGVISEPAVNAIEITSESGSSDSVTQISASADLEGWEITVTPASGHTITLVNGASFDMHGGNLVMQDTEYYHLRCTGSNSWALVG